MSKKINVVMMGATGAVGGHVVNTLLKMEAIESISLLGRNALSSINDKKVSQHQINILDQSTYANLLPNHQVAICTLGVGQPSKMSKEDFLRIDKQAVLEFAQACKNSGIRHFELLSSIGINSSSSSFYLRAKGELVEEIKKLGFENFSVFQPSMILTPNNRYGILQGITLKVWPLLKPFLLGGLRKYRGIPVDVLGKSMAINVLNPKHQIEYRQWDDFYGLVRGT